MATNNSTSDIEILVGVQGGESINEGSGKEISSTLKKIAQNISQQKLIKVTVGADQTTTKRAIQQVLNQSDLKLHNVGFGNNVANSLQSQLAKMGLTIDIDVNIKEAKKKIEKTQKKMAAEAAKAAKPDAQKTPEVKVSQGQVNRWIKSLETKRQGAGNDIMGIKEVADAWEKAQKAVNEYGSDVSKQGPVEAAAVDASIKRLDELISKYKKLEKANSPENRANSQASAKKALADFNAYLTTLKPKALIEFGDSIARIRSLLSDGTPEACKKAKIAINDLKGDMKRLGYEGGNVFTYLQEKVRTFATYLISSTFTMGVANTFSNVVSTVKDLDAALTDLQIVTGGTNAETKELLATYNKMAQRVGASTVDTATSATSWLRQGYNLNDTNQLIETSMVFSKVGFLEADEAATNLTSTILGYKLAVEDAMTAVDMFTKLDLDLATSAGEISIALAQTASTAENAGISLAKAASQLAVVLSVTQESGEVVGNFYRSMLARMQNIKAGRLEDPETGESLSNVETVLNNLGISLRNSESEFRNMGDVLDDVGEKWSSLTDVQQASVAVAMSGSYQQNRFRALMSNYTTALEEEELALNSSGTAMEKFETYQESLEARQQRLTASFEAFSTTLLNSGLIALVFDLGAGFLNLAAGMNPTIVIIAELTAVVYGMAVALNAVKASSIGASIKKTGSDLGWPKKTGDIVPIYSKKTA